MKLGVKDIPSFMANPASAQAVLIYGPDRGQVRQRADAIGLKIVPDLHDPFNVIELSAESILEDPPRLADELGAMSLMGGRRLIILRDVSDKLTDTLKEASESLDTGSYLLVTADELPARSSLRLLFESDKRMAALPCYKDEGANLHQMVRDTLRQHHVNASQEIIAYLSNNLGGDRQIILNELEKISLYAQGQTELSLEEVRQLVEGSNEKSLDDVCLAVAGGQTEAACRNLDRLILEGIQEVVIVRALHRYFSRLLEAHRLRQQGMGLEQAIKALRPPIFFKQEPIFKQHLERWRPQRIEQLLHLLMEAEKDVKLGGDLSPTLCSHYLLRICKAA